MLALLVVTGLGSQVSNNTLSSKERRFLVHELKESKIAFLKSVKGLSEAQLNFKPAEDQWSIKEYIEQLALTEDSLWNVAAACLQQPARPERKSEIADAVLLQAAAQPAGAHKAKAAQTARVQWPTADAAVAHFKKQRGKTIKYVKTTTEDVRSHITDLPVGTLDAYQVVWMMAAHAEQYTRQVKAIKTHPAFPH